MGNHSARGLYSWETAHPQHFWLLNQHIILLSTSSPCESGKWMLFFFFKEPSWLMWSTFEDLWALSEMFMATTFKGTMLLFPCFCLAPAKICSLTCSVSWKCWQWVSPKIRQGFWLDSWEIPSVWSTWHEPQFVTWEGLPLGVKRL